MDDPHPCASLNAVPLFPLPNVVLFPRAVLPLHIFEERYKAMTADALAGRKQVAMAVLLPGWEKHYYGRAEIEPIVCVGTIVSHEQLADGKYNFLLQGQARARVVRELDDTAKRPYRTAKLELLEEIPALEIDLGAQRQRLIELFTKDVYSGTTLAAQFRKLLAGPWPTPDIVDLIAFSYFDDVGLKQNLLCEPDVARRINRAVKELEALRPTIKPTPPSTLHPPSMN